MSPDQHDLIEELRIRGLWTVTTDRHGIVWYKAGSAVKSTVPTWALNRYLQGLFRPDGENS